MRATGDKKTPGGRGGDGFGSGAVGYDRQRDLPRLVLLWPEDLEDYSDAGRLRLMSRLRAALRAERRRGIAGHWSYDLTRHRLLLAAYRAEALRILRSPAAEVDQQRRS